MRLSITSDYSFTRTPDGAVWTDGPCHYRHWMRYLDPFDRVNVIARVAEVERTTDRMQRADGDRVAFSCTPPFAGTWQYLRQARRIRQAAVAAIEPHDAVILHVPGRVAGCVAAVLPPNRPYGVQVVGDPHDSLAPGVVRHPLRPFVRWWCTRQLKQLAAHSVAAVYVTDRALQRRYPSLGRMFGVSDADLSPDAFREAVPRELNASTTGVLVSVGTMSQLYKGFDVLLDAIAFLAWSGMIVKLVLIGDGRYRPQLEEQVRQLRLQSQVEFRGQLPAGARIQAELDAADVFVLPSRTEGLSRALLEAMARSLPCVATRVGGTPELLPAADLVVAGEVVPLAETIRRTIKSRDRRCEMAARNYAKACEFQIERLDPRRQEYFEFLAGRTRQWLRAAEPINKPIGAVSRETAP